MYRCPHCDRPSYDRGHAEHLRVSYSRSNNELKVLNELIRVKSRWVPTERLFQISKCKNHRSLYGVIASLRLKLEDEDYILQNDVWAGYRLIHKKGKWVGRQWVTPLDNSTDC